MRAAGLGLAALAWSLALSAQAQPQLMDWPDLMGRPLPKASAKIAYGPDPLQVAEVWRPEGKGPFPTVLMIHGGCWRSGLSNLHIMDYAAEDLRRRGIAVWNIEYRGVDRPGGGYPGAFQDVNAAADALVAHGKDYGLRTDKIVVLGHSAGGHLALWLGARGKLPRSSPLRDGKPLSIAWVVSLGGLPDLATAKEGCGEKTVASLLAGSRAADPLADTSPARLVPLPVPRMLIHGDLDDTSPPSQGRAYVVKARAAGDIRAWTYSIPGEGHVEEIAPGSTTWASVAMGVESVFASRDGSWTIFLPPKAPSLP
ncbi:alpha/beta hydrolase [Phenylobacterium sp.]|uniref:alpha/beta hydrolase family protein n=1 Tax=Phenylobacterium sp. TaxID=1871053 RepID=UPI0011F8B884|nr:alpha/beta hydrolase [Phenylobacterium sp.]THD64586.1 MAG: alpha/beta hydrolase [Phenylobacterium sp.]